MKQKHDKHHSQMIDNRTVHDNHQEGIGRVTQRKGDLKKGQGGRMGENLDKAHWRRTDASLTPRQG